jgi:Ca2+:H+ antiporter
LVITVNFGKAGAAIIFAMNVIAIISLAGLLSHAMESVVIRLDGTIGEYGLNELIRVVVLA